MRNPAKVRTCAGCGKKQNKASLLRIGKDNSGNICISDAGGRGAYICKKAACLEAATKKKRLSAVLKGQVSPEILSRISDIIGSDSN